MYNCDIDHTKQIMKCSDKYHSQFSQVIQILEKLNKFSKNNIYENTKMYFDHLGLNNYYFEFVSPQNIANNLTCVIASKLLNQVCNIGYFPLIHHETQDQAFWISNSSLSYNKAHENYEVEKKLENRYFQYHENNYTPWRLQCFRSKASIFQDNNEKSNNNDTLRTYFLQKPSYNTSTVIDNKDENLNNILDKFLLENPNEALTRDIFDKLNKQVVRDPTGLHLFSNIIIDGPNSCRLDLAFFRGIHNQEFFSRFKDCITMWGFYSKRKYVEPLANGVTIFVSFLQEIPENDRLQSHFRNSNLLKFEQRINCLVKALKMMYILPISRITDLTLNRKLTVHEVAYAYVASKFVTSFLSTVGTAFPTIEKLVKNLYGTQKISQHELYDVQKRLKVPPFSQEQVYHAISHNCDVVKDLYKEFQLINHPTRESERSLKNSEFFTIDYIDKDDLSNRILSVDSPDDPKILRLFRIFNRSILRTNFWKESKVALSFRFNPSFLPDPDYDEKPKAIFFSVGKKYLGYHVRFSDVARGGIRVVQSMTRQTYETNKQNAFDETYKLAYTQNHKNKDIAEGGSKGLILLKKTNTKQETEFLTVLAFKSYIDSMLDLLLPDPRILDRLGKSEIYFLGPDEHTGTGCLMDWAALHAKSRSAWFWRAFTTGKAPILGGIPHDLFGMTTLSVEKYIVKTCEKLNLDVRNITKLQTGGPDGDLGCNAILKSNTKVVGIIDKSGVLYDKNILNTDELIRLAKSKLNGEPKCVSDYNQKLLSKDGFFVSWDAKNITLPDGTFVPFGQNFCSDFFLNEISNADLFNPCGGRPGSINPFNTHFLINENGKCKFKMIIEGANVFLTDDARRELENAGCILFKDASTNKGGVTSSSMEVLAALALNDQEYEKYMQVNDLNNPPEFYKNYVKDIMRKIEENAEYEFESLWNEGLRTNLPRCDLTDILSKKINMLKNEIFSDDILWGDMELRNTVLLDALPSSLVPGLISMEDLHSRVPQDYLKAVFSSHMAARFYYGQKFSDDISAFAFFSYVNELKLKNNHTISK